MPWRWEPATQGALPQPLPGICPGVSCAIGLPGLGPGRQEALQQDPGNCGFYLGCWDLRVTFQLRFWVKPPSQSVTESGFQLQSVCVLPATVIACVLCGMLLLLSER